MMKLLKTTTFAMLLSLALISCSDTDQDDNVGSSLVKVGLTDAPAPYDSVLIDIQQVELTTDQGKQTAPVLNPGVYNLLDYANGLDTLLVSQNVPSGRLNQIRLILGNNNSVVINGQTYSLTTPSAQQSGLKLNVQAELTAGAEYTYVLDFDASRSVVERGNGTYLLKPVIRVITNAISGAIEGHVDPKNAAYYSYVVKGNDTLGTAIDSSGYFKIIAVPAGSYNLEVLANPGYSDQSLGGVQVVNGQITDVDTLNF